MSPPTEHLAIAFANTVSSSTRDAIATADLFRRWSRGWPVMARVANGLPDGELVRIHEYRDESQRVLHRLADRAPVPTRLLEAVMAPGLAGAPFTPRQLDDGRFVVDGDPSAVLTHLLGRAVADLLLGAEVGNLSRCAGAGCRKVFLRHRPGRRWCDSAVCGNRARVAAHARRARRD